MTRSALIRLATSLPPGSPERNRVLDALRPSIEHEILRLKHQALDTLRCKLQREVPAEMKRRFESHFPSLTMTTIWVNSDPRIDFELFPKKQIPHTVGAWFNNNFGPTVFREDGTGYFYLRGLLF